MVHVKKKQRWTIPLLLLPLVSCAGKFVLEPYAYGKLVDTPFSFTQYEGYSRLGPYASFSSLDHPSFEASLQEIYSFGSARKLLPSTGEQYLTVIPVDFRDYPYEGDYKTSIEAAFFGSSSSNQYVSLAEYYDKSSYHRLHVKGEVSEAFRCNETYATLKTKNNASQTKAALTKIYQDAVAWYNGQSNGRTLTSTDAVYFVYSAPYSGMDGGTSSRSSMMWAFAVNDPAPIAWSSYYMMHPSSKGHVDAHTYIHEFGHLLGLKDYYDPNSYAELSPCSPLGRMDMMDCSLGEHNGFSKMLLNWAHPYVVEGECEISLRPSSGNPDLVLLPLSGYNNTPYAEYVLLEFYTPTYLNNADATLREQEEMRLFQSAGIKAYHVDGRLGVYEARGKSPWGLLTPATLIGNRSLDFYCDNSGSVSQGKASSSRGFLIQLLDASSNSMSLTANYIASDHIKDLPIGNDVAHLRDSLYHVGQGIDESTLDTDLHGEKKLQYGFKVKEITATYATLSFFPLPQE